MQAIGRPSAMYSYSFTGSTAAREVVDPEGQQHDVAVGDGGGQRAVRQRGLDPDPADRALA